MNCGIKNGRAAMAGILLKGCKSSTAACEFWYILSISSRTEENDGKLAGVPRSQGIATAQQPGIQEGEP